jgi:uncharacterized repeat protein (TIGR03803 family)
MNGIKLNPKSLWLTKTFAWLIILLLTGFHSSGQTFRTLHIFGSPPAPGGPLVEGPDGTLYGTTTGGGTSGVGSIFKVRPDGSSFAHIYSFAGKGDGLNPNGNLVLSGNTLYGTALGGSLGSGSVFKLNTDGTGFANLYIFSTVSGPANQLELTNRDGSGPSGGLILLNGALYGTTSEGGA